MFKFFKIKNKKKIDINFERLKFLNETIKQAIEYCLFKKGSKERETYFDNLDCWILSDDVSDWLIENYTEIFNYYIDNKESTEDQIVDLQVEIDAYIITHTCG